MLVKELFEGYLCNLEKSGFTRKTIQEDGRFLSFIDKVIGHMHILDIRLSHRADIIDIGSRHGKHGSIRAVVVFRKLLRYAQDLGWRLSFDWRDIKLPKSIRREVEYLERDEIEKVRNSFDTNTLPGLRTRTLFEVLLDTGLRISEAISLDRDDIDYEKKEARVVNIKTKKEQSVYFTERSLYWIRRYLETRTDDHEALFISGRGRLLSVSSRNYFRTHTKHLGIKKHIRHHICRATLLTEIARGVDIKTAQDIGRHESERTTLRYYVGINKERSKAKHQELISEAFNPCLDVSNTIEYIHEEIRKTTTNQRYKTGSPIKEVPVH